MIAGVALWVGAAPASAQGCAAETFAKIADLSSVHAEPVAATTAWTDDGGAVRPATGSAFCRVRGTIAQGIGFEVWLPPADHWGGKLLAGGVGGEAGTYNYADMLRGLRRGYATASTDAGHRKEDRDWALDPVKRAAFAADGNHRLAVKAKAMIAAYYGKAPRRSYFVGCSGGGREALKEAQRFPEDFDGILAGGAGPNQFAASMRLLWSQYVVAPKIASLVTPEHWRMVSQAAIGSCDRLDGVTDGIIADPRRCGFRPRDLLCKPHGETACLSAAQVDAVERIYAPLRDEHGTQIDAGLLPGVQVTMAPRSDFAFSLFGRLVHGDPSWDPMQLNIARDMTAARRLWPDLPNDSTDLSRFRARGGRMIFYHGWMDPWILAQQPINWFKGVERDTPSASDFARLFMVPGMGHCRGGAGADQFGGAGADAPQADADHDMLTALERWVENGIPPRQIVASRIENDKVAFTRLLCPYPAQAVLRRGQKGRTASDYICRTESK